MAKDLFNRYVWLVDAIYRAKRITFDQLNECWIDAEISGGNEMPLRTFHNHREAIEQLFDINIECDKRAGYVYFIENADDLERGGVRSWLLNTFAVNNLINESHKLKSRILFENIPSGQQFLTPLIEAMRDERKVEITYQSFYRDEPSTLIVEPYCVKVFRQRWYLHAVTGMGHRTYALDRIVEMKTTDEKFKIDPSFDAAEFYADCYGIMNEEHIAAEVVELKVSRAECKDMYFKALPLHHSQEVTAQDDTHTTLIYHLRPSYDFQMELLSHGSEVEVVKPLWLRNKIAKTIATQYELYAAK